MKILNVFASGHNWLADKDFIWWPFSFLRPAPSEVMTLKHTLIMSACFGGLTFAMFLFFSIANNAFNFESVFSTLFISFFCFFTWFNLVTKPLWNVRAKQKK